MATTSRDDRPVADDGKLTAARIGFSTATLPHDPQEAERILACAWDHGVRHFDTSRMYGQREELLGRFARGRDGIVLVTKAGIAPQNMALPARLARKIAGLSHLPSPAFAGFRFGQFAPSQIRASIETSLRALHRERLDLLLLHDASLSDITPELLALLSDWRRNGLIGDYGLGCDIDETTDIASRHEELARIVQIKDSLWDPDALRVRELNPDIHVITHCSLAGRFAALRNEIAGDIALQRRWADAIGFDPLDHGRLGALILAERIDRNPNGTTLFGSCDAKHIAENMKNIGSSPPSEALSGLRARSGDGENQGVRPTQGECG